MSQSPLERLKRARVVQVLLFYLGASWVVLQIADVLQTAAGLPSWVSAFALLLLLIGLVVILATAWVQAHPVTDERERAGEVPGDWEVDPRSALASIRQGKLPHLTWARTILGGVVALSLLFGGAGAYVLLSGGPSVLTPTAAEADEAAAGIAVLPFSVTGADLELWRSGMVDLLSTGLDGVGGLRTIDSRTVFARWSEAATEGGELALSDALGVAGRTGARFALAGNAVALGPDVRLAADLYDLSDGSKVAQATAEGPADSVLVLADELGLALLRELLSGMGDRVVTAQRMSAITTASLQAMKSYVQGESAFRAGDYETAIRHYEDAVRADSTFALAFYRLADVYGWFLTLNQPETRASAARALRLADRLPDRHRALLEIDAAIGTRSLWSAEEAEALVGRYPDDPEAWTLVAEVNIHRPGAARGGAMRAREALDRALELEPDFLARYFHAIELAIGFADTARAAELLERARGIAPDDPRLEGIALAFRAYLGDGDPVAYSDSIAALETIPRRYLNEVQSLPVVLPRRAEIALSAPPVETAGNWANRYRTLAALGRAREATEALDHLLGLSPASGGTYLPLYHLEVGPAPESRLDALECSLDPPAGSCWMGLLMVRRGLDGAAEAARALRLQASDLQQRFDSLGEQTGVDPWDPAGSRALAQRLDGVRAWRSGDLDRAFAQLDSALRLSPDFIPSFFTVWALADVQEERGDLEGAVATLRALDLSVVYAPFSHLRIGELQERRGFGDDALWHYRSALSAWVRADPDFAPKARALEGLARLGG